MSQDLFSDSQLFNDDDIGRPSASGGRRRSMRGQNGRTNSQMTDTAGDDIIDDQTLEELDVPFSQMASQQPVANGCRPTADAKSLLQTNQTAEDKQRIQSAFVDIAAATRDVENQTDICRSAQVLTEHLVKQDEYFRSGGVNENMSLDAKCMVINSMTTAQLVRRLQTDSRQFDALEFAEKLLTALDPLHRMDGSGAAADDGDDSNAADTTAGGQSSIDRTDWVEFGRKYCRLHRVLPPFVYIMGAFDGSATDGERPAPKQRAVRQPKAVLAAQTEATQLNMKDKSGMDEDATPEEVEQILETIKKLERKNPDIPALPFFDVLVNPKSMSETVENIFHATFLVKDGLVRVMTNEEDAAPAIKSIENEGEVDATSQREAGIQSVFSFTMKDWQFWCQHFGIRKAAIKHITKKSSTSTSKSSK